MARIMRRRRADSLIATPSLTAAASPVNLKDTSPGAGAKASSWSAQAWEYYDTVGELRYVCEWLGNNLSQVTLLASDIDMQGNPTGDTQDEGAAQIVADIAGGPAGQAQLLSRLAVFLTVPGEGWVAVITREDEEGALRQEWHVLSADEIKNRGSSILLELDDGSDYELDPERDILTRVYRPHPRRSREADSPVHAALPVLNEIVRTSATIDGAAKSRLAGNGIFAIPSEVSMPVQRTPRAVRDAPGLLEEAPAPGQPDMYDARVSATDVAAQLQQVMTMAIQDPASAAALVPIVLQAPGEQIANIRHITFQSEITETALTTRDKATLRLARTLDVPQEVLMGMAEANHWSAWQIDEASIKTHIKPLMTIICDALTDAILRPLLRATGHPDPESMVIWFDTANLTQRPNRSEDAKAAFAAGAISAESFRRALGFTDEDAPASVMSTDQLKQLAIQMLTGAPSLYPLLGQFVGFPPPPSEYVDAAKASGAGGAMPGSTVAPPVSETHTPPQGA